MSEHLCQVTMQYTGRVQGVGFRYTTVNIARGYHVAGYVQNLPDGSVKLVAEGERAEINRFLMDVDERLGRYIQAADRTEGEPTGAFGSPSQPDTFAIHY